MERSGDKPLAAELRAIEERRLKALCAVDMADCEARHDVDWFWDTDIYERRDGRWQAVWSQATETRTT